MTTAKQKLRQHLMSSRKKRVLYVQNGMSKVLRTQGSYNSHQLMELAADEIDELYEHIQKLEQLIELHIS